MGIETRNTAPRQPVVTPVMTFGRYLQDLREAAADGQEMSCAELGRRAQVHASFITRLESEQRRCSSDTAARLDAALNAGGKLLALWQDTASASVAARAIPGVRLPSHTAATPTLVGVEAILNSISAAAAHPQPIIITGAAGCGKSALARKWANIQASAHPHGRLELNARGRCNTPPPRTTTQVPHTEGQPPRTAAQMLVQALDYVTKSARHHRYADDIDRLRVQLHDTLGSRRAILIIEDVDTADQVEPLMGISGVTTLVTSRSQLRELSAGMHSAIPIDVPPLDEGTMMEIISIVAGARVQGQHAALARIAAALDGNPLAARAAGLHILRSRRPLPELVDELTGADRIRYLHHAAGGTGGTSLLNALHASLQHIEPATEHLLTAAARAGHTHLDAQLAAEILHTSVVDAAGRLDDAADEHLLIPTPGGYRIPGLVHTLLTTTG